jgi:hypothetical protein
MTGKEDTTSMNSLQHNGRLQNIAAWAIVGIIALTDMVWLIVSDFQVNITGSSNSLLAVLGVGAPLWFYRRYRYDERVVATLSGVLLLIVFTAVAAPLSYLFASLNLPLWDHTLHRWDEALGLDWRSYLAWINGQPLLGESLKLTYMSLLDQLIIACLALGFTGRLVQLRTFVLAVIISGLLCVLISAVMPAMAMYVHLGLQPADFPNLSPAAAYVHVEHIYGLRDGTLRILNLNAAEGIITFPSYHASLAVIFLAAFWSVPLLRWPGVLVNLAVIAATPIDGGRYFVDVGAGIVIAVLSLLAARTLEQPFAGSTASVKMPDSIEGRSVSNAFRRLA